MAMKQCYTHLFYFGLLLLPIISISTSYASSGCANEEVQGVVLKTSYTMPPAEDPDPLIVVDIKSKVTSYFIPGHSYIEKVTTEKVTITLGPTHTEKTLHSQAWHTPDKVYSKNERGKPNVRQMQRRSFNTTPISLLTSTSDTRIFLDRECSWASKKIPGLGGIKTCSLAIYGWPHQIFAEIEKTKAKEHPILLEETCIPKSKFIIPELDWQ
ncbi:hypothetical protein [Neptunomonas antarctica]|nr:hypothetical protein [Neptunomonas antarctica]